MLKEKLPNWIKNESDPMVKDVLTRLYYGRTKPFDTPREMLFVIVNIPDLDSAQNAVIYLEQKEWACQIFKSDEEGNRYTVYAEKANYVLEETQLAHDMNFFIRIAEMYGGVYDGWEAELI
jgi:hypothetical protein